MSICGVGFLIDNTFSLYKLFLTNYVLKMIVEDTKNTFYNAKIILHKHQLFRKPVSRGEMGILIDRLLIITLGILFFMGIARY